MCRIAVIEDDVATRLVLDTMLTEEGYQTILLEGPEDLLPWLAGAGPDLVLLDLMLGGWGDGLTLATAIRADPQLLHVPLIVMSAAANVLHEQSAALRDLGCQVLAKPFDLDDLYARIAGALAAVPSCAQAYMEHEPHTTSN